LGALWRRLAHGAGTLGAPVARCDRGILEFLLIGVMGGPRPPPKQTAVTYRGLAAIR
jgi:hypothetical protein